MFGFGAQMLSYMGHPRHWDRRQYFAIFISFCTFTVCSFVCFLSVSLSACLFVSSFVCLSVCLFACLFVCLSGVAMGTERKKN